MEMSSALSLRPKHLAATLKQIYSLPPRERVPMYIMGPPGVGKSRLIESVAADVAGDCFTLHAQVHQPEDFKFPLVQGDVVKWVQSIFPTDPNWKGIVFNDELDKCHPTVQNSLLQLTLDGKLGEYVLPEGAYIVCAGNRPQDRTGSHPIVSALRARMVLLEYVINNDDWNDWALAHKLDPRIRTFCTKVQPELLHKFDPAALASPTPRSWEFVHRLLPVVPREARRAVLSGLVGEAAAATFLGYLELADQIPDVDDILANPSKFRIIEDPALCWVVVGNLVEAVRNKPDSHKPVCIYGRRLPKEFSALLLQDCAKVNKAILALEECRKWRQDHYDVML